MEKIAAPIDNKNLMEDPFEDEVFGDFDAAHDHRDGSRTRHLIGRKTVKEDGMECESGLVDVRWKWGDNCVTITLLAVPKSEEWEDTRRRIFDSYKREFKAWECEDNPGLVVEFYELGDKLNVIFYFECEEPDPLADYSEDYRKGIAYALEHLDETDRAVIRAECDKAYNQHLIPNGDIVDDHKITDLLEEYGQDNDLPEGWYLDEYDASEILPMV